MKKLLFAFFALLISVAVISCDDDATSPSDIEKGDMVAKVDGSSWESTLLVGIEFNNVFTVTGTRISTTSGTEKITLSIVAPDGPGTYTGVGAFSDTGNNQWVSSNATINITVLTTTEIKGTFSFMGTNTSDNSEKNITSGGFYAEIQ